MEASGPQNRTATYLPKLNLNFTPMIALQWIFLKKEDVENYLVTDQLQLFSDFDRKNSVDNIIRDVCAYIQSRTPESLTISPMAPNHIPNACRTAACHLVIEALQSRIPDIQLTDDQIRNAQQAHTTLNDLFRHWWRSIGDYFNPPRVQ